MRYRRTAIVALVAASGLVGACSAAPAHDVSGPRPTFGSATSTAPPPATAPAPTTQPATIAVTASPDPVVTGVHPGAFCDPDEGVRGLTVAKRPMVCETTSADERARWRKA